MRLHHAHLVALLAGLGLAAPAAADTVLTGTIGRVFSGDVDQGRTSYAGGLAFLGDGAFGFEIEATYTPHFFGLTDANGNVTTLMGNLMLAAPLGRTARLYGSAGGGLMKFRVPDVDQFFDVNENDFGVDAGGGLMLRFDRHFGVRGDLRYFRDLKKSGTSTTGVDFGSFHYWRGSVGLTWAF